MNWFIYKADGERYTGPFTTYPEALDAAKRRDDIGSQHFISNREIASEHEDEPPLGDRDIDWDSYLEEWAEALRLRGIDAIAEDGAVVTDAFTFKRHGRNITAVDSRGRSHPVEKDGAVGAVLVGWGEGTGRLADLVVRFYQGE